MFWRTFDYKALVISWSYFSQGDQRAGQKLSQDKLFTNPHNTIDDKGLTNNYWDP